MHYHSYSNRGTSPTYFYISQRDGVVSLVGANTGSVRDDSTPNNGDIYEHIKIDNTAQTFTDCGTLWGGIQGIKGYESSGEVSYYSPHSGWAEILDSSVDPTACYAVLFKKGYDLTFVVPGDANADWAAESCLEPTYTPQAVVRLNYHPRKNSNNPYQAAMGDTNTGTTASPGGWQTSDTPLSWNGCPTYVGSVAYGFAYGIQNIRPQKSKAIFRFDRYGQFRDMLEQRQDGKFFLSKRPEHFQEKMKQTELYTSVAHRPGGSQSPSGEQPGPIQCVFVDGDAMAKTVVSPYATDSRNMSHGVYFINSI